MIFLKKKLNKKGFALLFSVLVASLLLTIGLSIFRIALKELAISTASRQSIHAFYAADSGWECAKYWAKRGDIPSLYEGDDTAFPSIICAGQSIDLVTTGNFSQAKLLRGAGSTQIAGPITVGIGSDTGPISTTGVSGGPNFFVTIEKSWNSNDDIVTLIKSYGQDSTGGDRVQRAIEETY
jgi:hypothetical protein